MRDLLGEGQSWLADRQTESVAVAALYVRGGTSVSLPATLGSSEWEVSDVAGAAFLRVEVRDYLINCDLFRAAGLGEPIATDKIIEGGFEYQVNAPGADIPVWHWTGPARVRFRIHTKMVGSSES